ncbi:unnamed protein product [Larinioides sclopetarius]|uniref:Translation initiation factor 1 n=1 Tax=Larinioides sclopetarius TaxID=280406 RepID=A0AAV1ZQN0_9ARAC
MQHFHLKERTELRKFHVFVSGLSDHSILMFQRRQFRDGHIILVCVLNRMKFSDTKFRIIP